MVFDKIESVDKMIRETVLNTPVTVIRLPTMPLGGVQVVFAVDFLRMALSAGSNPKISTF